MDQNKKYLKAKEVNSTSNSTVVNDSKISRTEVFNDYRFNKKDKIIEFTSSELVAGWQG